MLCFFQEEWWIFENSCQKREAIFWQHLPKTQHFPSCFLSFVFLMMYVIYSLICFFHYYIFYVCMIYGILQWCIVFDIWYDMAYMIYGIWYFEYFFHNFVFNLSLYICIYNFVFNLPHNKLKDHYILYFFLLKSLISIVFLIGIL